MLRSGIAMLLCALALSPLTASAASSGEAGTFRSAGDTLGYTAFGTGPTVIVLAGGPGLNAAYMDPLADQVAALGYRAVVLDQRGTGASVGAGANAAMLTKTGTVADIDALRAALHQDRLTFVTHSFGGGMAMAYAAAHPTRVANLVMIGSVGADLANVNRFGQILMTHLSPAERKAYDKASRSQPETALNIQILAEFVDRKKARETIATEPHPLIYPAISNAIYTDFAKTYHVQPGNGVKAPITLITGSEDAALVMQPGILRAFPAAQRVPISRSGHWPWIENPGDFGPALKHALAATPH